jgi:hypothetical protein
MAWLFQGAKMDAIYLKNKKITPSIKLTTALFQHFQEKICFLLHCGFLPAGINKKHQVIIILIYQIC